MRKIIGWLGVAIMTGTMIAAFVAYFVVSLDPSTKTMFDGFGRPLSASPVLMRLVFGQERLWAGAFWFLADMVLFWGGLWVGFSVAGWGLKKIEPAAARGPSR